MRLQAFEGTVIAKRNGFNRETFTVRRMSYGIGVERTFPLPPRALTALNWSAGQSPPRQAVLPALPSEQDAKIKDASQR